MHTPVSAGGRGCRHVASDLRRRVLRYVRACERACGRVGGVLWDVMVQRMHKGALCFGGDSGMQATICSIDVSTFGFSSRFRIQSALSYVLVAPRILQVSSGCTCFERSLCVCVAHVRGVCLCICKAYVHVYTCQDLAQDGMLPAVIGRTFGEKKYAVVAQVRPA